VLWIRNTIKKVTIVVPVFIISCHVSLKPNMGPVIAQATMINTAAIKVTDLPDARAVHLVKRVNHDLDFVGLIIFTPLIQRPNSALDADGFRGSPDEDASSVL
jgi:hypothetical protein